ncbi:MAG TPA: polysaccharide deacetylase family protein [Falsiroseomonas sp.]|jgi:peptidoglycan/xylan/chitin deacetylase (PgdA/CDA1 family)|nr:polysaccharide deacetylase family protein [Falsiroseomonas sp.]
MPDDLDSQLAELTEAARRYDARHEPIPDLAWPEGARIAVNFTADFDAMLLRRLMNEPRMQLAKGEFGGRVGIWRLVELFDGHGVKATIFTPGRICELYPRAVLAAQRSGHEIADHMWEHRVPKEAELERDHLQRSTAALEALTGHRPAGTRSYHSHGLLRELGYLYRSNGSADHRPHYLRDADGKHCMVNLPFHYAIDDAMYFSFAWMGTDTSAQRMADPERVLDLWWDAFRQQHARGVGGYLNICLHPFVSGRALRIAMLDRLITRMKELPGVWFPTCEAVARHCLDKHPPRGGWN